MELLTAFLNYLEAMDPMTAFFVMSILIVWMGLIAIILCWLWKYMRPAKKLPPFIDEDLDDDQWNCR